MKRNVMLMVAVMAMVALAGDAWATACAAPRNTPHRTGEKVSLTMASNVIVYAGSMVCVDSSGLANPAADTSGFAVIGMAEQTVDNRTAVYVATKKITVDRGVFRWANADVIAAADIGKIVYVTDDATVNKTGGGQNIIAGSVIDVDSDGVWVDTAKIGPIGAATPSSLGVSGAATVGTTLTVTGLVRCNGGLNTDGGTFSVADTTGNTVVGGTLDVTGASTVAAVTASGTVTANGALTTKGTTTLGGTTVAVTNNLTVAGTVGVTGIATLPLITGLGKVFTLTPITNIVYNGGATTGNLYIVTYTP